jgi:predicted flap endonuclease-1-like 5' DNA nuclease
MTDKKFPSFFVGFIVGVGLCVLAWYWQKSTKAEDGALALLDRLAAAEARIRQLRAELAAAVTERPAEERDVADEAPSTSGQAPVPTETADLTDVRGIGPVYASRLHQEGIGTVEELADASIEQLARWLNVGEARAETILAEARRMAGR